VPLSGRGALFPPKGVGWSPSPRGRLPYPPSGRLRPRGRAAGEVLTEQTGEVGDLTAPVDDGRPGGTPPQPPVDIVGHASRPDQPAPTAPVGYESPRTDSVGIPAAPPANGPGGRFAPPAPPARHLRTADGQFRPATMTPPVGGAPFHSMPPDGAGAPRSPQLGNGSIGSGVAPAPFSGLARRPQPPNGAPGYGISQPQSYEPARPAPASNGSPGLSLAPAPPVTADRSPETPAGAPGPALSRPAWATSDRPAWPLQAAPAFNVSIPPPLAPGRPLPPPGGEPRPGLSAAPRPIPGGLTGNGGSPSGPRRPDTNGARHHGGAPHPGDPPGGWRPLPEPALASPQRPAPHRTVGRLAALGPDPASETAARPAPTPPRTAQDFSTERVRGACARRSVPSRSG
jgi:hypothetical protein